MTAWLTMWRALKTAATRALSTMVARVAPIARSSAAAAATWTSDPAAQPVATDLDGGDAMTTEVLRITDDTTRAELEEAMHNIVATLHRMPAHWADKRTALHAKLDAMLEDWE